MSGLHLSRARLRRDADVAALAPLLLPGEPGAAAAAAHRLVWSLFAGDADAPRDFLWREEEPRDERPGRGFVILSHRPPNGAGPMFEVETRPFAPVLARGDRLAFVLRANPAVDRREGRGHSKRHDAVMDALTRADGPRSEARPALITEAGRAWLDARAGRLGFSLPTPPEVDGYQRLRLPRGPGRRTIRVSMLDYAGVLTVEDPAALLGAIARGIGRARAFGCGLMLIRRA